MGQELTQRADRLKYWAPHPGRMEKLLLDPNDIVPRYRYINAPPELVDLIRGEGFLHLQSLPVYPAPVDMQPMGKYLLIDGHRRRAAAIAAGVSVPCALYKPEEDIVLAEHDLAPFYIADRDDLYDFCVASVDDRGHSPERRHGRPGPES